MIFQIINILVNHHHQSIGDWYPALGNSEVVGIVFNGLNKAFETVDHSILCNKLRYYMVTDREFYGSSLILPTGSNLQSKWYRCTTTSNKYRSVTRLLSWPSLVSCNTCMIFT